MRAVSTFGGVPDPYSNPQRNDPYGSGPQPAGPYYGSGPQPADPYRDAGTTPPYHTDQGPYTHPAPAAPPSGPSSTPGGADQAYLRPGAYGTYGHHGAAYGGYPPLQNNQNVAGGWSLGLGIAGLVLCLLPVFSQLIAVAGIITGVIGVKAAREGRADNGGMATIGIVLSAIGLVLGLGLWIGWAGWWASLSQSM